MPLLGPQSVKTTIKEGSAELSEFIASLKGKSPAEAMGHVSSSRLVRALLVALLSQVVLLLAFTLPSYWSWEPPKPKEAELPSAPTPNRVLPATTRPAQQDTAKPATAPVESDPASKVMRTDVGPTTQVRPTDMLDDLIDKKLR